jgi:hypothetical protein
MGFDTHMIAGAVPALRPARPTQPNITNRSNPHYDETLARPEMRRPICQIPARKLISIVRQPMLIAATPCY